MLNLKSRIALLITTLLTIPQAPLTASNSADYFRNRTTERTRGFNPDTASKTASYDGGGLVKGKVSSDRGSGSGSGLNKETVDSVQNTLKAGSWDVMSGGSPILVNQRTSEEGSNKMYMHGNLNSMKAEGPLGREAVLAALTTQATEGKDPMAANALTMIKAGSNARFQVDIEVSAKGGGSLNDVNTKNSNNIEVKIKSVAMSFNSQVDAVKGIKQIASGEFGELTDVKVGSFDTRNASTHQNYVQAVGFKVDVALAVNSAMGTKLTVNDLKIESGKISVNVPNGRSVAIQGFDGAIGKLQQIPPKESGADKADHAIALVFTPPSAAASAIPNESGVRMLQPSQIVMGSVAAQRNEAVVQVIASDPTNTISKTDGKLTITSTSPNGITVGPGIREAAKLAATSLDHGGLALNADQFTVVLEKLPGRAGTQMVTAKIKLNDGEQTRVDIGGGHSVRVTSSLTAPIVYTFNPIANTVSGPQMTGAAIASNRMTFVGATLSRTFNEKVGPSIAHANESLSVAKANPSAATILQAVGSMAGVAGHALGATPTVASNSVQTYRTATSLAGQNALYAPTVASPLKVSAIAAPQAPVSPTAAAMDPLAQLFDGLRGR